jgi:hypothetical protein
MTMPAHFKNSEEVVKEFEQALVAYVSLRREGLDRITTSALAQRIELTHWVFESYGYPFGNCMVTPMTEVATTPAANSQYMTTKINGVLHIGVMMPVSAEGARTIVRPVNGEIPSAPSRSVLYTSNVSDITRVPALRGAPQNFLSVVKAEAAQTLSVALTKSAKRVTQQVRSAITSASLPLHNFATDEWEDIRESVFTTPMHKVLEAKLEAAHEQLEHLISEAELWHSNLGHSKVFVRKHKEAHRSRKDANSK